MNNKTPITKTEFIQELTTHPSLFVYPPNPHTGFSDEQLNRLSSIPETEIQKFKQNERTAEKHSTYIQFSDGSRTDFNQKGKYSFFKYTFKNFTVYEKQHCAISQQPTNLEYLYSHLYYIIRK